MSIFVKSSGTLKPVTRVYQKVGTEMREILLVQYAVRAEAGAGAGKPTLPLKLVTVHDRYLAPPTGIRGVTAVPHSSGTLAWDADPPATGYQVLKRPADQPTATPEIFPSTTTWTPELSYTVSGLAQNTSYDFTVRARRPGSGGFDVVSPESIRLRLNTGYPAITKTNPYYPAAWEIPVVPSGSGTWTPDHNWAAASGSPDVVEGYLSSGSKNARGCVAYATAYQQVQAAVNSWDPNVSWSTVVAASARIERIHRKSGGSGTPAIDMYNCNVNFGGPAPGPAPGPASNPFSGPDGFQAPVENDSKYNLTTAHLLGWVGQWIQPWWGSTPNGLMLYRTGGAGNATAGYNGYAVFQEANFQGNCWRLIVGIMWAYTIPGANPVWSYPDHAESG